MEKKVALVTGSGRRLGRQIAIALAESGFDIVVNYNRSRDEAMKTLSRIRELGRDAIVIKADITKGSQVKRMVEKAIEKFGQIDVLVNNAAIFPKPVKFWEISDELWDYVINTNLKGQFLCSREVVKFMLERKKGKIINIASLGGLQVWTEQWRFAFLIFFQNQLQERLSSPFFRHFFFNLKILKPTNQQFFQDKLYQPHQNYLTHNYQYQARQALLHL